jgi:hypothetical protein
VHHSVVERVPEVPKTTRLGAWHAEVVDETSEISLSWQTNRHVVFDAVGFICGAAVVAYT